MLPERMIRFDVLCYGTISFENTVRVPFLPHPRRDVQVIAEQYHPGGEAVNVGVTLAGWGLEVALIGNLIGEDEYGNQIITALHAHPGVDLRYVARQAGIRTPFRRVLVTPDGERSVLGYWFDETPKVPLTVEVVRRARLLSVDVYGREERIRAAQLARDAGRPVVAADVVWPDHPMLQCAGVIVNSYDFTAQQFPGVDVREHMDRLRRSGQALIITTLGNKGCVALDHDGNFLESPAFDVPVVDTTSAGEVFKAGVLYAYLQGWPIARMLRFANAAAALKCSRESLFPPPTLEEVLHLIGD
ncbi:MAG: carbohydrate kinase family protein [Anaerolineae bacterium]|nr:carbohydrate kinase family protein [Thermoflexales bacterium]MDW8406556.1 carbohydrate kinase family protein [Anaerolineae bacterium]